MNKISKDFIFKDNPRKITDKQLSRLERDWHYIDERSAECGILLNGRLTHRRSVGKKYGNSSIEWLRKNVDPNARIVNGKTKIKYVFALDRRYNSMIAKSSKPYPKKEETEGLTQ